MSPHILTQAYIGPSQLKNRGPCLTGVSHFIVRVFYFNFLDVLRHIHTSVGTWATLEVYLLPSRDAGLGA